MAHGTVSMQHEGHSDVLLDSLYDLYKRHLLTDIILVVDGAEFHAHVAVLVSFSKYFKHIMDTAVFYSDRHHLKNTTAVCIELLLDFMYSGSLQLTPSNVLVVLASASQLQITQAVELCQEYLTRNIGVATSDDAVTEQENSVSDLKLSILNSPTLSAIRVKEEPGDVILPDNTDSVGPEVDHADDLSYFDNADSEWQPSSKMTVSCTKRRSSHRKRGTQKRAKSHRKGKGTSRKAAVVLSTLQKRQNYLATLDKRYSCPRCPKTFSLAAILKLHLKNHGVRDAGISNMTKRRKSIITWQYHQSFRGSSMKCERCRKSFRFHSECQGHFKTAHSPRFLCKQCPKTFQTVTALQRHAHLKHHSSLLRKGTFTCSHCLKVFLHDSNFARHMIAAHPGSLPKPLAGRSLECRLCQKQYKTLGRYKDHLSKHGLSSDEIAEALRTEIPVGLPCQQCSETFPTASKLHLHKQKCQQPASIAGRVTRRERRRARAGSNRNKWTCHECNQRCPSYKMLKLHMRSMHPLVLLHCPTCSFQTQMHVCLQRHVESRHQKHDTSKVCEMCGKCFPKKYHLKFHLLSKHDILDPSMKVLSCEVEGCDYVAYNKSAMRKHAEKHNTQKAFNCETCGKLLKTERNLQLHINKRHRNIRPYICDQCGMSYGQESELKTHMVRHGLVKQYQCEHCDYASHDKDNYRHHLYALHKIKLYQNMKIFQCQECDFNTTLKYRFSNHMKVHMEIRDLPCPDCGKLFMTRNAMRQHIVRVHKPKSFKCLHCPYQTSERSKLVDHTRVIHTHRNYKPYKCAYCDFVCATNGNCRKHVMQRHRGMEVKCIKLAKTTPDDFTLTNVQLPQSAPITMQHEETPIMPEAAAVAMETSVTMVENVTMATSSYLPIQSIQPMATDASVVRMMDVTNLAWDSTLQ